MHLAATDDGFSLTSEDISVSVACEHQTAQKPQHDNIRRQLARLGGTVYECSDATFSEGFDYFVPNSVLGELRRQLVEAMEHGTEKEEEKAKADGKPISYKKTVIAVPHYDYPYLYNIANRQARDFYHADGLTDNEQRGGDGLTAYELRGGDGPLMQCRHCLRYALGYCVKYGGQRPVWREPLSLRLSDGRQFRLEFDCKNCQMNVYAACGLKYKI